MSPATGGRVYTGSGKKHSEMADAGETRRRPCDVTEVAAQLIRLARLETLVANPSFSVEGGRLRPRRSG